MFRVVVMRDIVLLRYSNRLLANKTYCLRIPICTEEVLLPALLEMSSVCVPLSLPQHVFFLPRMTQTDFFCKVSTMLRL